MGGSDDDRDVGRSREHKEKKRRRSRSKERSRSRSRERRKQSRSPDGGRSRRGRSRSPGAKDKTGSNGVKAEEAPAAAKPATRKKSRFSEATVNLDPAIASAPTQFMDPILQAQLKAQEIAMNLGLGGGAPAMSQPMAPVAVPPAPSSAASLAGAALQAQIQASLQKAQATLGGLGVPTGLGLGQSGPAVPLAERKAKFKKILLDEKGREIDEEGNLVKVDLSDLRTVKANIAGKDDKKKKEPENPYLAYSRPDEADQLQAVDPRLKLKDRNRRSSRAFAFVQQGTYIRQAENMRNRERSKILAGFTSGRNPNAYSRDAIYTVAEDEAGGESGFPSLRLHTLPPLPDDVTEAQPDMEWWDEAFLPKDKRATLAQDSEAYAHLSISHSKTYTYIQHPVPVRGPMDKRDDEIQIPTFLTKKERKRLRKQARAEREREKRDKIALGLIPPPPPKMNLSNFMKVLANEAIADPSAVTHKVQQQIAEREKNHEMRNQARKLTPEERREKKRKKIIADKSKEMQVALFRVRDLSSPKIRYKIDVNAQQYGLTGAVLSCRDPAFGDQGIHLVVVEGGPRAIRRYLKLMLKRIKWDAKEEHDEEEDEDEDEDEEDYAAGGGGSSRCELIWKGTVHKASFNGFKFQECRTVTTARKVMEAKGVAHYFDMLVKAAEGLPIV